MDQQKIDMFLMSNGSNFPEEKTMFIREKLLTVDDSKWSMISVLQFKRGCKLNCVSKEKK